MLNDPALVAHVLGGALREWKPTAGVPVRQVRTLLFTPTAFNDVFRDPWRREPDDRSDRDARERRRSMHAIIGRFVGGQRLAPAHEVKLLDSANDGVFADLLELRSGPPRPQSRLFAYVYSPGTWVAVSLKLRSDLGELGDPRWAEAATECAKEWTTVFPTRAPKAVPFPCNTFAKLGGIADG